MTTLPPFHSKTTTLPPYSTRLQGGWLWVARIVWGLVAALTWWLFIASYPANLARMQVLCSSEPCASGQITPAGMAALTAAGFSLKSYALWTTGVTLVAALVYSVSALVIVLRRSDDWLALLAALMLITFSVGAFTDATRGLAETSPFWWLPTQLIGYTGDLLFMLFILVFPSGRFAPHWAGWLLLLWAITRLPHYLFPQSPLNLDVSLPWLYNLLFLGGLFSGMSTQVYRYWRVSNDAERLQTKWVVFGLLTAILGFVTCFGFFARLPDPVGANIVVSLVLASIGILFMLLIPITLTIAVLRRRLWEIDPIINRALVYGTLTVIVIGLYIVLVGGLSTLFQTQGNFTISVLATGVAAVLFEPLRNRLQRGINRLMYGERDDPYAVISRLGKRLENTLAPHEILPTVVQTVGEALKLPYAAIQVKGEDGFQLAAQFSVKPLTDPKALVKIPLTHQGETVGQLLLAERAQGEAFSLADRRLLNDLAHQAGIATHAVRLTFDLQQLTADLQHSRERIISAREEERRRLRRDLHDGLGPALANLTLQIEAAREFLQRDPARADALLADLAVKSQTAINDIRRLVYDLRPPTLDEFGLLFALREQAAQYEHTGLHTTVSAPEPLPGLPAAVEVAVYRIAQEALTNVTRHAQAHNCWINLEFGDDLTLKISDDGRGLPEVRHSGVGLLSMRERAEELGGNFTIESAAGQGVQIEVRFPLPSA